MRALVLLCLAAVASANHAHVLTQLDADTEALQGGEQAEAALDKLTGIMDDVDFDALDAEDEAAYEAAIRRLIEVSLEHTEL